MKEIGKKGVILAARQQAKIVGFEALQAIISLDNNIANRVLQQYSQNESVQEAAILLADSSLFGYYAKLQDMPLPVMDAQIPLVKSETDLIITEPIYYNKERKFHSEP